jgi:hypothetical protein
VFGDTVLGFIVEINDEEFTLRISQQQISETTFPRGAPSPLLLPDGTELVYKREQLQQEGWSIVR